MNKLHYILAFVLVFLTSIFGTQTSIASTHYGVASWYGGFHQGRLTANGERFDMHKLTAAHRTYPFGTILKVTNMKTKRSVLVKVTDRGPYKGNRIIDLTKEAANRIGMLKTGTSKVRIGVVSKPRKAETHHHKKKTHKHTHRKKVSSHRGRHR